MFYLSQCFAAIDEFYLFFSFLGALETLFQYHIHTWQASTKLICGDTCQIWIWIYVSRRNENFFSRVIHWCNFATNAVIKIWRAAFLAVGQVMMTLSNRNIFRVSGPLWGKSIGHRWIPLTKTIDAELWCFLWYTRGQTVAQMIETPEIWDAIALIMTSRWCIWANSPSTKP